MAKSLSAKLLLSKHVTAKDRILLVNPPVEETRYSWIRWNQPLDLLKLATLVRRQAGCFVELLDCMKPDADGTVPEEWLPGARRYYSLAGERYPMRRFGKPYSAFRDWLVKRRTAERSKVPTQVWVTSLCSYWADSVAEMCRVIRHELPGVQIVLLGQLPRLLPEVAKDRCAPDMMVTTGLPLDSHPAALDLYTEPPPFLALRLNPKVALAEIKDALARKVTRFAFFEEDLGRDGGEALIEVVTSARPLHRHIRFHAICGLYPDRITRPMATLLADRRLFAAVHLEEATIGGELDLASYDQARAYLGEAGVESDDDRMSGFVWMGRPHEDIESLVRRSFHVLDRAGGIILKPFTPLPGSADHQAHREYLSRIPYRHWSPHFFPFAELNGITRTEYHDLYRLAAFLNERVRSRPFDFFAGTMGAQFLRSSLRKEVWNLEPSPLRVINQPADL